MIWIVLAAMALLTRWNTNRYAKYLDNVVATVKERLSNSKREVDQEIGEESKIRREELRKLEDRIAALESEVTELRKRPEVKAREASLAALNQILRR